MNKLNLGISILLIFIGLIFWIFCTHFSARLAQMKGRSKAWGMLGFFFSIIGFIVVCFLPSKREDSINTNPILHISSKIPALSKKTLFISIGLLTAIILTVIAYDNVPSWIENYKYSKQITEQNKSDYEQATTVVGTIQNVFAGTESTFALTTSGNVYCFGKQQAPQLENQLTGIIYKKAKKVTSNENLCFILDEQNNLYAIGNNKDKFLPLEQETLKEFTLVSDNVIDFSISERTIGIIKTDNKLYMYGNNVYGQLGNYDTETKTEFVSVLGNVTAVHCEADFTVALQNTGEAVAFGANTYGQIGKEGESFSTPTVIATEISQIAAGDNFIMLLNKNNELSVCGGNDCGQLGNGKTDNVIQFTKILSNIKKIDASKKSAYALSNNNELYAWGQNTVGQLGDNTTVNCKTPKVVHKEVLDFVTSGLHTIIITNDREFLGTGYNNCGQLGKLKSQAKFESVAALKKE